MRSSGGSAAAAAPGRCGPLLPPHSQTPGDRSRTARTEHRGNGVSNPDGGMKGQSRGRRRPPSEEGLRKEEADQDEAQEGGSRRKGGGGCLRSLRVSGAPRGRSWCMGPSFLQSPTCRGGPRSARGAPGSSCSRSAGGRSRTPPHHRRVGTGLWEQREQRKGGCQPMCVCVCVCVLEGFVISCSGTRDKQPQGRTRRGLPLEDSWRGEEEGGSLVRLRHIER